MPKNDELVYRERRDGTWVPEKPRPWKGMLTAALVAFIALTLHRWWTPHGQPVSAPLGTTLVMTRTAAGWQVTATDGTLMFTTSKVRVDDVDHHD